MDFRDILNTFRKGSFSKREQGTKFELLMLRWLKTCSLYKDTFSQVWMFSDFPSKADLGGVDTGIDLIAKTYQGDFWAIQCKCYDESATISEYDVSTFITMSGRKFRDPNTLETKSFSCRLWISTTSHFGRNALNALYEQTIPVTRIGMAQLENSDVDWDSLLRGEEKRIAPKETHKYQKEAINAAATYFADHDRGKLIMACGTGKTFTSLRITEKLTDGRGFVLFLVPSISLLSQSLESWMTDRTCRMKAICVCSDADSSKINDNDDMSVNLMDIPLPACTNKESIVRQMRGYNPNEDLVVVFSTYQSVDKVQAAQTEFGVPFDLMICDEAHRTTGVNFDTGKKDNASNFIRVHDNDYLPAKKRMYMTATPRIYKSSTKINAADKDFEVCSMNDEKLYGDTFFNFTFAEAVDGGWLTDYKVLVLTMKESYLPPASVEKAENGEYMFNDATKLAGCINALSKKVRGDDGITFKTDPRPMKRAVAFCTQIRVRGKKRSANAIYSEEVASMFPQICEEKKQELLDNSLPDDIVNVKARHIDGSMDSCYREELLNWLKDETKDSNECRILSNVRCLSEGVDVPALDAVLFLSGRSSKVDIIQSVGRVMRTFKKGEADEKKYGYIIIPVVVDENATGNDVLNDHERFSHVWKILESLRSHDDRLANEIEVSRIDASKPRHISVVDGGNNFGMSGSEAEPNKDEATRELYMQFGDIQSAIYGMVINKVGDRIYWERWASRIATDAQTITNRITSIVAQEDIKPMFDDFVSSLRMDINNSITDDEAISMLAQHLITAPIFETLFENYSFAQNNSVSISMEKMVNLLKERQAAQETEYLVDFYESVRKNLKEIKTFEGKQKVLKELYEKFFKTAFPEMVKKLGIVYTPIECVDYIVRSVDKLLRKEFGKSISDEGVHVLDPFTGTGTFVTRLLQSGLIRKEDLLRKYRFEIHCNEIVLLAYYVADVNIEAVYHELTKSEAYVPYDNICLTDTFQMKERKITGQMDENKLFGGNTEIIRRQMDTPIQVIIGNPPYEDAKDNANDKTEKTSYPHLEQRVSDTYISRNGKQGKLDRHTYNSFFLAFRWASDRIIENPNGGIIGFISNGSWIDNNLGFRKTLINEFSKIYVINLRGNCNTKGELRKKEGDGVFGEGSRSQIAITFLVRNPKELGGCKIYYHDIGDYKSTKEKKALLTQFKDIDGTEWEEITPSAKGDWINHQTDDFTTNNIPLEPDKRLLKSKSFFAKESVGVSTNRDAWIYNTSKVKLAKNMASMIEFFNKQKADFAEAVKKNKHLTIENFISNDATKISWSRGLRKKLKQKSNISFDSANIVEAHYRPFCKMFLYWQQDVIEQPSFTDELFPIVKDEDGKPRMKPNKVICVSGSQNGFTVLAADTIADLHYAGDTKIFPLYYYVNQKPQYGDLFSQDKDNYVRKDGITDWVLETMRKRYGDTAKRISKEMVFYYVYGLLHSEDYRRKYANDLVKQLPYIPIVDRLDDFLEFYRTGKRLMDLHLDYENVPPCPDVKIEGDEKGNFMVEKMRYKTVKGEKQLDTIVFNDDITISNIPLVAYEYVLNGFPAIHHVMDRYCMRATKGGSGIVYDPNDWVREHNKPRYILDLLLSIINLSVQTVQLVKSLPKLEL